MIGYLQKVCVQSQPILAENSSYNTLTVVEFVVEADSR